MNTRILSLVLLLALLSSLTAAQENGRHQSRLRAIPGDNIGYFSETDRSATLQLVALQGANQASIGNAQVTIIDRGGEQRQFTTDENGRVKLNQLHQGAYAIVASNNGYHGALLIAMREVPDSKDLNVLGFKFDYADMTRPIQLGMLKVSPKPLRSIFRQAATAYTDIPLDSIDTALIEKAASGEQFEFQIQLGEGGTLRGQLLSVMDSRSFYSTIEGTHIVVLKDGVAVRKATADADGRFEIKNVVPGVHGIVVFGRGGYAAFAFEAVDQSGLVVRKRTGRMFAMSQLLNDGEIMPVALVPPPMFNRMSDLLTKKNAQSETQPNEKTAQAKVAQPNVLRIKNADPTLQTK